MGLLLLFFHMFYAYLLLPLDMPAKFPFNTRLCVSKFTHNLDDELFLVRRGHQNDMTAG